MVHAHYIMEKMTTDTLRIYNTYCLSTSKIFSRMRLNVTFICTLSVLLYSHNIQPVNII